MTFRTGDVLPNLVDHYAEGTHGSKTGDVVPGLIEHYASSTRGSKQGDVIFNAVTLGSAPPNFKNQGYYVAGSAFEEWVTIGLPSTFPPSAHTLADIQHMVLET